MGLSMSAGLSSNATWRFRGDTGRQDKCLGGIDEYAWASRRSFSSSTRSVAKGKKLVDLERTEHPCKRRTSLLKTEEFCVLNEAQAMWHRVLNKDFYCDRNSQDCIALRAQCFEVLQWRNVGFVVTSFTTWRAGRCSSHHCQRKLIQSATCQERGRRYSQATEGFSVSPVHCLVRTADSTILKYGGWKQSNNLHF